jgi:hypothetical protein
VFPWDGLIVGVRGASLVTSFGGLTGFVDVVSMRKVDVERGDRDVVS